MKINPLGIDKLNQSKNKNAAETAERPAADHPQSPAGRDSMQVSALAKRIAQAKAIADQLPDVRADKVAAARRRLASGYYDSSEAQEVLVDKLASLLRETHSK